MTANYDDPMWGSGAYFKFESDGDKVSGNLVEITSKTFEATEDRAAQTHPVFHLEQSDGTVLEVTINYADLKKQIRDLRPAVGSFVGIKRNRKVGKMILFDVVVRAAMPLAPTPTNITDIDANQAALVDAAGDAPF